VSTPHSSLPVQGKAFRFAPAVGKQPASNFWKIWAEGAEVYLLCRTPGGNQRFSIHQSGQVHYRLAAKEKQDLAPLLRLASGPWTHAIELRFLMSPNSLPLLKPLESLKNKKAHVVPVPEGFVFHANLLIGDTGVALDCPLPTEFSPAAQTLWRARLRDNRLAVLIGRVLQLSDENREHIRFIRQELKPTVTLSSMSSGGKQLEVHHLHWSPQGGNVVFVVPMGDEAFRADDEPVASKEESRLRQFLLETESAELTIRAPDESPAVQVRIDGHHDSVSVVKGKPLRLVVGQLHLDLLLGNLVLGSSFIAAPCKLPHMIKIGTASPRDWNYSISARFDGTAMIVELRQLSTALRNANLANPVHGLADPEELVLTVPDDTRKFTLSTDTPRTSCKLVGKLTLRDRR
jgi:hypothetical protein